VEVVRERWEGQPGPALPRFVSARAWADAASPAVLFVSMAPMLTMGAGRCVTAAMAEHHDTVFDVRFDGKTDPQIFELLHAMTIPTPAMPCGRVRRYADLLGTADHPHGSMHARVMELLDHRTGPAVWVAHQERWRGAALKLGGRDRPGFGSSSNICLTTPIVLRCRRPRAERVLGRVPRGHEVVIIGARRPAWHAGQVAGCGSDLHRRAAYGVRRTPFSDLTDTDAWCRHRLID
jgi:hypothetical protein